MNGLQKEIENRHLPELMRLENGDAVTNCMDWKLRREEIKKLFCHEYMGVTPENIKSTFECVGVDEDAYGGKATEKTMKVQLANNNDAYEFIFKLILPKAVKEKAAHLYIVHRKRYLYFYICSLMNLWLEAWVKK